MTRKECIDGLQAIIDEDRNKVLVRVHVGYLIHAIKYLKEVDCEHAEQDGLGCLEYCRCEQDDEPIESCKRCEKYTGNIAEKVEWE